MTDADRGAPRLLVCEPKGFGVHHLLNPWMAWSEQVDVARARRQWHALCTALDDAGASVEVMPHTSRSGAMTFTRDTAVVVGDGEAIVLRNVGRRGELEPDVVRAWLDDRGFTTEPLPDDDRIDGGNVVPTADGWAIGIPARTPRGHVRRFAADLHARTGTVVHGVPLVRTRFGHLDTAMADLAGRAWLLYPGAFAQPDVTDQAWRALLGDRPVISVEQTEAEALACNVVVVGDHVIGGLTPRLAREVEALDLHPVPLDLDEFRKAGGGAHCLTLELDPVHASTHPPDQRGADHVPSDDPGDRADRRRPAVRRAVPARP